MLVAGAGREDVLLDFFVSASGARGRRGGAGAAGGGRRLLRRRGADVQHRRRLVRRLRDAGRRVRGGRALRHVPLAELAAPAAALARDGLAVNAEQAYLFEILSPITALTAESRALFWPDGRPLREGETYRDPALADALERLGGGGRGAVLHGRRGRRRARVGGRARRDADRRGPGRLRGGAARARARRLPRPRGADQPAAERRRHAARAARSRCWTAASPPPSPHDLVAVMERAQSERTPAFLEGLDEPGFLERFMASRLGLDDAHLGAGRRRLGVRGDVHERRGLRAWSCPARACT